MQTDLNTALKAFALLPDEFQSPCHHPYYVVADALRDRDLEPVFFIYKGGGEIFYHAFHIGKVSGTDFYDVQSPYAYGGPLSSSMDAGFLSEAWEKYMWWCRDKHILAEFVRFHPLLENWCFYPGKTIYMRETVWIDLQENDIYSLYSSRVRTSIRKAIKNQLRVEWVNTRYFYTKFYELYIQSMNRLQADPFYYFALEYFEGLTNWDQCYLAFCFQGQQLLAAALFLKQAYIMEYHLSASTPKGKRLCATSLLLHEAVMMGRKLGCRILHLGGGTDNQNNNPLLFFKAGFSPYRVSFRIGKMIHEPAAYEQLRSEWQSQYGQCNEKTLFYRFPERQKCIMEES